MMDEYFMMYLMMYGWRDQYGREYGIDPEDYEYEEDFLRALEAAREREEDDQLFVCWIACQLVYRIYEGARGENGFILFFIGKIR